MFCYCRLNSTTLNSFSLSKKKFAGPRRGVKNRKSTKSARKQLENLVEPAGTKLVVDELQWDSTQTKVKFAMR